MTGLTENRSRPLSNLPFAVSINCQNMPPRCGFFSIILSESTTALVLPEILKPILAQYRRAPIRGPISANAGIRQVSDPYASFTSVSFGLLASNWAVRREKCEWRQSIKVTRCWQVSALRQRQYACSHSPWNLPAQVIQILKTRCSGLRVHRIRKVWYALFDAQTRLGTA